MFTEALFPRSGIQSFNRSFLSRSHARLRAALGAPAARGSRFSRAAVPGANKGVDRRP